MVKNIRKLFIFDPWPITYKLFCDNDGQQPVGRAIVGIFSTFLAKKTIDFQGLCVEIKQFMVAE
jgi:hypothetical protein